MNTRSRNWLIFSGAVWGFVMAAIPSLVAFDDPFTVSPFLIAAPLAAISIWLMMAINMSGFSEENLGELLNILNIFRESTIWLESLIVAQAVFVYAVVVGLLLSPVSGVAIRLLSRF